jgi:hypothetical protein
MSVRRVFDILVEWHVWFGSSQTWKPSLQIVPVRFEPGWQLQPLAEVFRGFVHGKSRRVRRNLEQDSTGLTKVNRVKIDPVDDWGHVVSAADEIVSPCQLLLVAWRAKRDVMHGTRAKSPTRRFRLV